MDVQVTEENSRRRSNVCGVISVWEVYTLEEAKHRLRWSDSSLRTARRSGLKLLKCGKRKYVTGREIRRYLESLAR